MTIPAADILTHRHFLTTRRILALTALLWSSGCDAVDARESSPAAAPEGPRALEVETQPATQAEGYDLERDYTGELRAARRQTLGFEIPGRVNAVLVREGQTVEADAPLAVLDGIRLEVAREELAAQLSAAQANLEEAVAGPRSEVVDAARARVTALESDLSLAEKRLVRRSELLTAEAASTEDVDAAAATVDAQRANLAGARSQLAELESGTRPEQLAAARATVEGLEASLRRIDVDLDDLTLRAPFAGTIAARHIEEGAIVSAGMPALDLIEAGSLEAWIGVPPEQLEQLERLRPAVVVRHTERDWLSLRTLPELDLKSRTVMVILELAPGESDPLRPGELARLRTRRRVNEPGYWVPTLALSQGVRGLWSLFVIPADAGDGPSPAQRANVEVLHVQGAQSYVRGTLQAGDLVVLSGTQRIAAGQLVAPRPPSAASSAPAQNER